MLKGPYAAILLSACLHLLLLAVIVYSSINVPKKIKQVKPKVTTIKSFLYKKPKKSIVSKLPQLKKSEHKTQANSAVNETANASVKKITAPAKKTQPAFEKPATKTIMRTIDTTQVTQSDSAAKSAKPAVKASTSNYDRLSRLRNRVQKQQREQAFNELTQQRSLDIMRANPLAVPHATVPLTREQKYQQNTSTSHVGSITKNDNGTCTIHREQILGSPVEATTSTFACGESKFDKNFREHMQKVQAKLSIKK